MWLPTWLSKYQGALNQGVIFARRTANAIDHARPSSRRGEHGHSDDELAAVANFVNGFFGNATAKVTTADIDKARKALP